jgi:abhydrolase domain-containing protein 12
MRTFSYFRREWYKLWQLNGFYVLAIDYRGYGDSSGISQITETSLVHDAMSAFVWLQKSIHPESQIMVWGHSLGTGVACRLGWNLKVCDKRPVGYILEAPFDSMHSVISQLGETGSGIFGFTMGTLSKFLNYIFDTKEMLEKRDLIFDSEKSLLEVKEKVIILHAKDDSVVPFELGAKLYKNMVEKSKDIDIFSFDEEHALGHDDIYKYKEIDNIIKDISKMK